MKGDGEGESEGARENGYGKPNNDIKVSRRRFIKTTAAFGAAVAGIPTAKPFESLIEEVLMSPSSLKIYPYLHNYIDKGFQKPHINLWGCNWDCRLCINKFLPYKDVMGMDITIDEIMDLLSEMDLEEDKNTMFIIGGGEPLLQKSGVLEVIKCLKRETDYIINLLTNGSLVDANLIDKLNSQDLDRISVSVYNLDNEWHKWYTCRHTNKATINALKLISEKFKGLTVVSTVLFPEIDMESFENMCKFLYEMNPDFVIKIHCPHGSDDFKQCYYKRFFEAKKIALLYFERVAPNLNEQLPIKQIRYKIKRDESGSLDLLKTYEWKREKPKEVMKVG